LAEQVKKALKDKLLTPAEVASMFRVDPKTVTRWAAAGRISNIKTPGGHARFRESEVEALLAGEEKGMEVNNMKIRFMCLKHYVDINIEGVDRTGEFVKTPVLYGKGDGTYVFDFSNCYCPEFDSLTEDIIDTATEEELKQHACFDSWTAVMYENFTKIGE
jgi:excisionase family DNA binding protein